MPGVLLIASLVGAPGPEAPRDWGPWGGRWAPVQGVEATHARQRHEPTGPFESLYQSYRSKVSSRDGAVCPFYPTCSGYAILAVRNRGPVVGTLLAFNRLMREYPWMHRADHYPLVIPHETRRLYDPAPPRRERRR